MTVQTTDDSANTAKVTIQALGTLTRSYGVPCDLGKCLTVQVLLQGISGEMQWSPSDFTITTDEGDVYETTGLYKEPSLPYDITLKAGKKVRGWLTYNVPKTLKHGFIHYADVDVKF